MASTETASNSPVSVECYSGYTFAERPTAFVWRDRRYQVAQILKQWRTPSGPAFQVMTSDDSTFTLSYDESRDTWSLKAESTTTHIKGE
jgi:hypothetical protein